MNALLGNRVTENNVRDWLSNNGYFGRSAEFSQLELYAIRWPGWQQVFKFIVDVRQKSDNQPRRLFGAVREDERFSQSEIGVFPEPAQQRACLESWSHDMIRQPRGGSRLSQGDEAVPLSSNSVILIALAFVILALGIAGFISIVG